MTKQKPKKAYRKRQPRAQTARKAAGEGRRASASRALMKGRISALDARMAIVERLLESINNPHMQMIADDILTEKHLRAIGFAEEE